MNMAMFPVTMGLLCWLRPRDHSCIDVPSKADAEYDNMFPVTTGPFSRLRPRGNSCIRNFLNSNANMTCFDIKICMYILCYIIYIRIFHVLILKYVCIFYVIFIISGV